MASRFRSADARRIQAAFDASLAGTDYSATVAMDDDGQFISVRVADPDEPGVTVVSTRFDFSATIKKAVAATRVEDSELQQVARDFALACAEWPAVKAAALQPASEATVSTPVDKPVIENVIEPPLPTPDLEQ